MYELKCRDLEFLSVKHLSANPIPHLHNEVEIVMNLGHGAQANVIINGIRYSLNPNECIYIAPGQMHFSETLSEGLFWIYIFSPDYVPALKKTITSKIPEKPVFTLCGDQTAIDIRDILRHYWNYESNVHKHYCHSIFISAINLLMAKLVYEKLNFVESHTKNELLQQTLSYITENYTEQTTIKELSAVLNVPEYIITKTFNETTGITIPSFRNWLRVTKAAQLLNSTNETITSIATEVGFNSIRNFNFTFAKFYKMTPSEYRDFHKTNKQA